MRTRMQQFSQQAIQQFKRHFTKNCNKTQSFSLDQSDCPCSRQKDMVVHKALPPVWIKKKEQCKNLGEKKTTFYHCGNKLHWNADKRQTLICAAFNLSCDCSEFTVDGHNKSIITISLCEDLMLDPCSVCGSEVLI